MKIKTVYKDAETGKELYLNKKMMLEQNLIITKKKNMFRNLMKLLGRLLSHVTHNKKSDLKSHTESSEKPLNIKEIIEIPRPIPGSPLAVVTIPTGLAIVLGNNVVSNRRFESFDDAAEYVEKLDFDLIISVCQIILEQLYELKRKEIK